MPRTKPLAPIHLQPAEFLEWMADIAEHEARTTAQRKHVARARSAFTAVVGGDVVVTKSAALSISTTFELAQQGIDYAIALAERAARFAAGRPSKHLFGGPLWSAIGAAIQTFAQESLHAPQETPEDRRN